LGFDVAVDHLGAVMSKARGQELMSNYDEFSRVAEIERAATGKPSHLNMDMAFCARMHAAITAGLERAPTGVVTTPGTKNPRYVTDLTERYHRSRNEW